MTATDTPVAAASPAAMAGEEVLVLEEIHKYFGGVHALRGATLHLRRGEVLALVGDNGAGKSTLIKTIMGVHQPNSGRIVLDGRETVIRHPEDARARGIEAIYQDLALVGTFDVARNFFLGREKTRKYLGGLIELLDVEGMRTEAMDALRNRVGIRVPNPYANAYVMSGGQRQAIAIGRAVHFNARIIIMDEPTAALGVEETERVLAIIERLRADGLTVLMVSHNLEHVFRCADRIAVMHGGRVSEVFDTDKVARPEVVAAIMGSRIAPG